MRSIHSPSIAISASRVSRPDALRRLGWILVALLVNACSGGSNGGGAGADQFSIAVVVAENQPLATGSVDWDAVPGATQTIWIEIPEDTALDLRVGPAGSNDPVAINVFPESGAAGISDGILEYRPDANYFGDDAMQVRRNFENYIFRFRVTPVNDAPMIVGDIPRVAEQGIRYSARVPVANVDDDVLVFSSANLPSWLELDDQTGQLTGTPEQQDVGMHPGIQLIVRDPEGLDDVLSNVSIEVLDLNDAPTLNISQFPSRLDAGESISVNVFPDDVDGDAVTLVVEPNSFLTTSVAGGTINVTAADVQGYTDINLVLVATDQLGNQSREVVPLEIFPKTASGRGRTLQGIKEGSGLHLVVVGDGYREDQMPRFREDTEFVIKMMDEDPAVATHLSAWNIHMIETPSVDSGIDDNVEVDSRDTVFDAGYFCLSVPRLICADNNRVFDVVLPEYKDVDVVIMLVNDPRYGGSGGSVAIASSSFPEIALHELGHSLAGLADEYVDSSIPALGSGAFEEGRFDNVSQLQDPNLVPWNAWIDINNTIPSQAGDEGVGIFQGGYYDADVFFRPTYNSRMRTFDQPFGPVNGESWALSVYRQTNPVRDFGPRVNQVFVNSGESSSYSVTPVFDSSIQRIVWTLNGRFINDSINESTLTLDLEEGEHVLVLRVDDSTGAIRRPGPHSAQFVWRWDITVQ